MSIKKITFLFKYLNLKTIYFNFKCFPFLLAIKFPMFLHKKVLLKNVEGKVNLPKEVFFGMVRIGFGDVGIFDKAKSRTIWEVKGSITFEGSAVIGHGSKICVGKNGKLLIGSRFNITAESTIICFHNISIGDECLLSWDILIMDTDFHTISKDDIRLNPDKPILIGNKVWVGARSCILKGSVIPNGCVIAIDSLINKFYNEENCVMAGSPAKKVIDNIEWAI
ncbi:acyltransferase [Segetibacter koreensis]|uniref:acyltransferase n=1 Tax=Segetibacter koreensis TaxID=398037 RepID=UPI00037A8C2C|nr:acyltransferase [Segetibacter koreensis]